MLDPIVEFESECEAHDLQPVAVLARAGLHRSNWQRWKSGESSPTVRNFIACRAALADMVTSSASAGCTVAHDATGANEKAGQNVSRTDEPGSSSGVAA